MARVSVTELRYAWAAFVSSAKDAGLDTSGWTLTEGSRTQGVSYSAHAPNGFGVPGTLPAGVLGRDCREAYTALQHMTATMKAVALLRNSGV
jgi:hypothetical protein